METQPTASPVVLKHPFKIPLSQQLSAVSSPIWLIQWLVSGINPEEFAIYGMDGTDTGTGDSEDEKTPLHANNEAPR